MDSSRMASVRLICKSEFTHKLRTMDGSSIGVYGEAKAEYTRQLCSFLVPALEGYFLDVLNEVKATENDPKRFLWVFQDALKQFPDWNMDKVQRETEKISAATKCDYLEEILTAVFIAHTKVLSAIRLTSKQKKLQITIPKLDHFLHRTMSECARLLWSNAYLFSEAGPAIERQKNLRQVEQLLHEGVLQSIRGMLPVKSILREYLAEDAEEGGEAGEAADTSAQQEEETAPIVHEESLAPAPAAPEEEKEEKEEEAPVLDVSGSLPPVEAPTEPTLPPAPPTTPVEKPAPPSPPTIVVETEPPTVGFTHMDAIFDASNPEKTTISVSNPHEEDDEEGEVTRVEFDETEPAEPFQEFEELEPPESLAVGADEFETL
jgi:hypothetical protein